MKKTLLPVALLLLLTPVSLLFAQDYHIQLRSTLDYPGQTLANICGYAQGGREYALVGASRGLSIVDVTDPENIFEIVQVPGPNNRWREIKTYSHYAYITTEGGGGVQIVDLSGLPGANLTYHSYTDSGRLNNIHALHIDVTKGFLYTYGGNQTTALAHDLNPDPFNPVYAGRFDQLNYVHDGYVDNDTLYACHINEGFLSIVDMSDKKNPVLLGSVETPAKFTHNSWLLSDRKHILTTDERVPSFVTAYDISDPGNIRELDRIARDEGMQSIGHNTHVLNDWAVTSWYIDGVTIVDAHRPVNLIQVGRFDTWAGNADEFDGCWGVYPFLPSGNLVATNIPVFQNPGAGAGRLFVLTPTYVRACYLEGAITDGCTGQALIGADVKINHSDPLNFTRSDNAGVFRTGQPTPGNFTATISKTGYVAQTLNISLKTAGVTELNVTLEPQAAFDVEAAAVNAQNGAPLAHAELALQGEISSYQLEADDAGKVEISCMPGGDYRVGAWGYEVADVIVENNGPLAIPLAPAYYDDFELDLGWSTTATASAGLWERGVPAGTTYNNRQSNPGQDVDSDNSDHCYVTGNAGGSAGADDVDNGTVTLTSPPMRLEQYSDAVLNFWYWFFNDGGTGDPNDNFSVQVSNGQQSVTVLSTNESQSEWRFSGDIHLKDFLPLTDDMRVSFVTSDQNPGHLVEAAVDVFRVTPGAVAIFESDPNAQLHLTPNPSNAGFLLNYIWPEAKTVTLEVRNLLGQPLMVQQLDGNTGNTRFGNDLPAGIYLVALRSEDRQSVVVKALKQ